MHQTMNRTNYLDYLKIWAMFAVVFLHVAAGKWFSVAPTTYEWQILNIYDSIVRWAVPVFVMVSGALFLDDKKEISLKKLYGKNILRLVISFVVWSLLYAGISYWRNRNMKDAIHLFIKGNYHMWFLFMIVGLYILVPILRKIVESKKITEYFLVLTLIFTFLIPNTVGRISIIEEVLGKMHFHLTLGFVGYFVAGAYLNKRAISKVVEFLIYLLGVAGFVGTICLTSWISLKEGQQNTMFYSEFSVPVMLQALSIFTFAKCRLSRISISEKAGKVVAKFAKYGFGIYLVHAAVLDVCYSDLQIHALTHDPIYMVPLMTIGVWLISLLISFILNQIPGVRKYIV